MLIDNNSPHGSHALHMGSHLHYPAPSRRPHKHPMVKKFFLINLSAPIVVLCAGLSVIYKDKLGILLVIRPLYLGALPIPSPPPTHGLFKMVDITLTLLTSPTAPTPSTLINHSSPTSWNPDIQAAAVILSISALLPPTYLVAIWLKFSCLSLEQHGIKEFREEWAPCYNNESPIYPPAQTICR
jgi:hypothetical protein